MSRQGRTCIRFNGVSCEELNYFYQLHTVERPTCYQWGLCLRMSPRLRHQQWAAATTGDLNGHVQGAGELVVTRGLHIRVVHGVEKKCIRHVVRPA